MCVDPGILNPSLLAADILPIKI